MLGKVGTAGVFWKWIDGIAGIENVNMNRLGLKLLLVLDALLAERNVTRAAAKVGLSQPAMSNALARLRDALDDPLLVRTPQGMVPTPRAEALAAPLARALADLERAFTVPEPFDPSTSTRCFNIAATDYMELTLLPRLMAALRGMGATVQVALLPLAEPSWAEALADGALDLTLAVVGRAPERLRSRRLFDEAFACLLRRDHPAAAAPLTLERFVELPHLLVSPRGGRRGIVDEALERRGLSREVVLSVPHFLMAPAVVAQTDLIATVPSRVARAFVGALPVVALPPPLPLPGFSVAMSWHERQHHDPAHQWLREQLARLGEAA